MRFSINLSSEPYENLRPLRAAVVGLAVLALALAVSLWWKAEHSRSETRTLAEQSDQLDKELIKLRQAQGELTKTLFRPDVQTIRDRSNFLNSLIVKKSLSWSQMFMDLEKVLPDKVAVAAVKPTNSNSAEAQLSLTVMSLSVPSLVELLKNLEGSPQFAKPVVNSQRYPGDKSTDQSIALDLTVVYRQNATSAAGAPTAEPAPRIADARPGNAARGER